MTTSSHKRPHTQARSHAGPLPGFCASRSGAGKSPRRWRDGCDRPGKQRARRDRGCGSSPLRWRAYPGDQVKSSRPGCGHPVPQPRCSPASLMTPSSWEPMPEQGDRAAACVRKRPRGPYRRARPQRPLRADSSSLDARAEPRRDCSCVVIAEVSDRLRPGCIRRAQSHGGRAAAIRSGMPADQHDRCRVGDPSAPPVVPSSSAVGLGPLLYGRREYASGRDPRIVPSPFVDDWSHLFPFPLIKRALEALIHKSDPHTLDFGARDALGSGVLRRMEPRRVERRGSWSPRGDGRSSSLPSVFAHLTRPSTARKFRARARVGDQQQTLRGF